MKIITKRLLNVLSLLFVCIAGMSDSIPNMQSKQVSYSNCHYGQCQAIAKSTGNQCQHCVSNAYDIYCWQHK